MLVSPLLCAPQRLHSRSAKRRAQSMDVAAFNRGSQPQFLGARFANQANGRAPGAPAAFANQGQSCATSASLQNILADLETARRLAAYPTSEHSSNLFIQLQALANQYIAGLHDTTKTPIILDTTLLSNALREFVTEKEKAHMGEEDASNSDAPGARHDLFFAAILRQEKAC